MRVDSIGAIGLLAIAALAACRSTPDPVEGSTPPPLECAGAGCPGAVTDVLLPVPPAEEPGASPPAQSVGPLSGAATCVSEVRQLELPELALYLMLDSSASMEELTGSGSSKWDAVRSAILGFLARLDSNASVQSSERLQLGLQYFPLLKPGVASFVCTSHEDCGEEGGPCFLSACELSPELEVCRTDADCPVLGGVLNRCIPFGLCSNTDPPLGCSFEAGCSGGSVCEDFERTCVNGTSCDASRYASPAVAIGPVASSLPALEQSLLAKLPEGLTPTAPALRGSLEHAREWASAHPEQTVAVVLATDGLPTECGREPATATETIDEVLEIAAAGVSSSIRTFVIGVLQADETASMPPASAVPGASAASALNLNAIAAAGGTEQATFVDSGGAVAEQFEAALAGVVRANAGCQLPVRATAALDFFRVELSFGDAGSFGSPLAYVSDAQGCAGSPNAWHYDVAPEAGTPSSVQLCPELCQRLRLPDAGSLQLQIACAVP